MANDVDGVEPSDEEYRREKQQQNHRQAEECARRGEQVGRGIVTVVATVADTSSVPLGAHGAI